MNSPELERFFLWRAGPLRQARAEGERRDERGLLIEMQIAEHF
jgi:hypothetical protein